MKTKSLTLAALLAVLMLWLPMAWALPKIEDVQAATQRGDYAGAEQMMRQVVEAKPDSARAHYVLAEILAHQRQFAEAREHATRARTLDPAIKFTDPTKFSAFEHLLEREHQASLAGPAPQRAVALPPPATRAEPASGGGVPVWVLIGGAILFIAVAAAWMRRRAPVTTPVMAGGGPVYGAGYGPGVGYPPGGAPSAGSGLMGVGLAAAGGVAAGMLAEKLLHGDHDTPRQGGDAYSSGGYGGFDAEAGAARDLENRSIDFGSGDSWDAGGSSDAGGGGGGGDDW